MVDFTAQGAERNPVQNGDVLGGDVAAGTLFQPVGSEGIEQSFQGQSQEQRLLIAKNALVTAAGADGAEFLEVAFVILQVFRGHHQPWVETAPGHILHDDMNQTLVTLKLANPQTVQQPNRQSRVWLRNNLALKILVAGYDDRVDDLLVKRLLVAEKIIDGADRELGFAGNFLNGGVEIALLGKDFLTGG